MCTTGYFVPELLEDIVSSCKGQEVNPDISGIGVRLSFYLQNALLVILVDRSWQDAPSALWTFIFTSFALTISAIVQAAQQQLSLFQALTVSNLVWLANFGTFFSLASYSRHRRDAERSDDWDEKKKRSKNSVDKVQYFATVQTFFSMVLTIFIWAKAHTFGNQDDCAPSVKYVAFFAVNFPALGSGRDLGLAVTSLLMVVYTMLTLHELLIQMRRHRDLKKEEEDNTEEAKSSAPAFMMAVMPPSRRATANEAGICTPQPMISTATSLLQPSSSSTRSCTTSSQQSEPPSPRSSTGSHRHDRARRDGRQKRPGKQRNWLNKIDPMFFSITVIHSIILVYFIFTTELLLRRNPAADNSAGEWGFGQIFALIVVVPALLSVLEALVEHGIGRLHHRTKATTGDRHTARSDRRPRSQSV